jgi:hypothetical protein
MNLRSFGRPGVPVLVCMLAVALAPAAARAAASRPTVKTGGAANVTQQTATIGGSVNPNGAATTYFFQYGPTSLYGAATPTAALAGGRSAKSVATPIAGLAPFIVYHYRLVANNAHGLSKGADRTFKTPRQPLGLVLAATPNPLALGGTTTLAGTLTGTGNASRQVILQANPFPYTQGFQLVGNAQVANAQGGFSFPVLSVPLNTQYRVVMPAQPTVVSPIVSVGVAVLVSQHVRIRRSRHSARVRFSGTIRPARDGAQIAIQKLRRGTWVTIGGTITHHASATRSRYAKTLRLRRGGTFRVFAGIVDGNYVSNVGRSRHIRVHR